VWQIHRQNQSRYVFENEAKTWDKKRKKKQGTGNQIKMTEKLARCTEKVYNKTIGQVEYSERYHKEER
jgi:hypothetical protein